MVNYRVHANHCQECCFFVQTVCRFFIVKFAWNAQQNSRSRMLFSKSAFCEDQPAGFTGANGRTRQAIALSCAHLWTIRLDFNTGPFSEAGSQEVRARSRVRQSGWVDRCADSNGAFLTMKGERHCSDTGRCSMRGKQSTLPSMENRNTTERTLLHGVHSPGLSLQTVDLRLSK